MLHLALLAAALLAPQDTPYPSSPVRTLYALHPDSTERTDLAGDALVLDTHGAPVEDAHVALFRHGTLAEVAITDADGHADLTHTKDATRLFAWKENMALVSANEQVMYQHRALAKGGPLLLELDDPVVIAGTLLIDGKPAPAGTQLELDTGAALAKTGALAPEYREALAFWNPPVEQHTTHTDKDGHFRFEPVIYPLENLAWRPRNQPAALTFPGPAPLFLQAGQEASADRRLLFVDGPHEDLEIRLETGLWFEGQLFDSSLGLHTEPAAMDLFYRLETGTHRRGPIPIEPSGHFRFPVARAELNEHNTLDLTFESGVPGGRQTLHFEIQATEPGSTVQLGTLSFDQEDTLLLRLIDQHGLPIAGAPRVAPSVDRITNTFIPELPRIEDFPLEGNSPVDKVFPRVSWPTEQGGPPTNADGKLLVKRPPAGWSVQVDIWGFEPRLIELPKDGARHLEVQLQPAAELTLAANVPTSLTAAELFVQLEANEPAMRIFDGDFDVIASVLAKDAPRTSTRPPATKEPANDTASKLAKIASRAPWHFALSFDEAWRARFADFSLPASETPKFGGPDKLGETNVRTESHQLRLHLRNLRPAVPFHIKLFTLSGKVFLDADIPAFKLGEKRNLKVLIPTAPH